MPEIAKSCDHLLGYNFNRDQQAVIGHFTKLTIGTKTFAADQQVKSPIDESSVMVVAVLTEWYWKGGDADPFSISGFISEENKAAVNTLLHTNLRNTEVLAQFNVYEYYNRTKKYFKCVHSNDADMKCIIEKNASGNLSISVASTATKISGLVLYAFSLGMAPQREEQDLHIATSDTDKIVKKWGIKMT